MVRRRAEYLPVKRFLAILILLPSAGAVRADITSNLVAHWKLDETSGTVAADSSGNGYTGTYVNTPTLGATGAFGSSKAVTYTRSSSEYTDVVAPANLLRNVSAASGACWFKANSTGVWHELLDVNTGAASLWTRRLAILVSDTGGKFYGYAIAGDAEGEQIKVSTATGFDNGSWHHFVVTVDYPTDTIKLYADGVLLTATGTVAFTATATSDTNPKGARIGSRRDGVNYVNGTLDDVRIYSRALSAADVAELYAYTGARPPYWYFDSSGCDPFKVFRSRQPLAILTTR